MYSLGLGIIEEYGRKWCKIDYCLNWGSEVVGNYCLIGNKNFWKRNWV